MNEITKKYLTETLIGALLSMGLIWTWASGWLVLGFMQLYKGPDANQ